ncbi:CYP6 [Lepeophtheirus salmonis]|uniref:CYP6 n=1 Tax=Lepeophtheirus salmonis TaxID=72036 RepID=A0A7R8CCQ4_LEPSM|nr:CYP6 [Lepeophtheirus salmonis]CAF2771579.1 CYP6 [Lepeophtheirus salmonis]
MIDVFDLMSRFTMESISRIILGIEGDCLRVKKSLFLNFIRCLSERNEGYPIITGLLDMIDTFYDIICTSIERISESTQFSLIQLLLWDGSTMPSIDNRLQEQDTYILSYVFLQFLTYFETTTSIHTIATLYLANNPTVQDKLREEICNRREWSIDGLEDMKYLNKVCHEIVELHPELKLIRYNNKIYRLPGTNLDIVEGTQFTFPYDTFLQNIHDERCFPSLDHGKAFAILTLGILLMTLLPLYKIKRNNKTGKELLIQIGRFKGAWVKLERINEGNSHSWGRDYPIREKPIVEVGTVAKEKSPEPSISSSTSQSDLLPLILPLVLEQLKSLAEKKKKQIILLRILPLEEPWRVQSLLIFSQERSFRKMSSIPGLHYPRMITKLSSKAIPSWEGNASKELKPVFSINKIQALLHPMKDSFKKSIMIDSSYYNMDLKFLLFKDFGRPPYQEKKRRGGMLL